MGVTRDAASGRRTRRATVGKMPESEIALVEHFEGIRGNSPGALVAYVEQTWSRPMHGSVGAFAFGKSYGSILTALAAARIPTTLVSPQRWQAAMGCRTKGDKNVSKAEAQRLVPKLRVTHATADALLIAEYGRRTHGQASGAQGNRQTRRTAAPARAEAAPAAILGSAAGPRLRVTRRHL